MINLFKQNTLGQVIVILLAAIALWSRAFIQPIDLQAASRFAPLYEPLYMVFKNLPRLASGIALLLVLLEGAWLNLLLASHKIVSANSLMPTMVYLLMMSWNPSSLTITPQLIVNIAVIATCSQLYSDGSSQLSFEKIFNAAFCIGFASLCYLPALGYILPFLLVFIVYKLYKWRDIAVAFFGLIAPYIVYFLYTYLNNRLQYSLILMQHDIVDFKLIVNEINLYKTIGDAVLLSFLLASILLQLSKMNDNVIHRRINVWVSTLTVLGAVVMAFYETMFPANMQALSFPAAFLLSAFLLYPRKRKWINETLFWTIIAAVGISAVLG
ncbi:MAG: hypothetical protein K6D59_00695 [Bacteroidales bacterium]|nr:hypothetical protein [Bacteroidales bacterium]